MKQHRINLSKVGLETSSSCQLKCPSCPTASGKTGETLGVGHLSLPDFQRFVDANPGVAQIELSNWGEILLNPQLPGILEYAYRRNVGLYASNGVNMNHAPDPVLEAMARWKLRTLKCSIDGAGQTTYSRYRVGGDYDRVIEHIRRLNHYKAFHRTQYPRLNWQFVIFGHNEEEIEAARALAGELNMEFSLKLAWDDLYDSPQSPVKDKERVRRAIHSGVADRDEYRRVHRKDYTASACKALWNGIKINHDGRVLGCSINYWGDYGNAFTEGLLPVATGEKLEYARAMLLGRKPPRKDIPCSGCKVYRDLREHSLWIQAEDLTAWRNPRSREHYRLENKVLGEKLFGPVFKAYKALDHEGKQWRKRVGRRNPIPTSVRLLPSRADLNGDVWKSYKHFSGRSLSTAHMTVHTSALLPGHKPHPPHSHRDEELLLMLEGEADLLLPDHPDPSRQRLRIQAGEFVYYPGNFHHTLEPVGTSPAVYTMFKWKAPAQVECVDLPFRHSPVRPEVWESSSPSGKQTQLLFQGATRHLRKLRAHATRLAPEGGYDPHGDSYDVAIVLLRGEVESLGERVPAPAVFFYQAGDPHGMRNTGREPAEYLVFEFHSLRTPLKTRLTRALNKIPKPPRVRHRLKSKV